MPGETIKKEFEKNPILRANVEEFYLCENGSSIIKTFQLYSQHEHSLKKLEELFALFKGTIWKQLESNNTLKNIEDSKILNIVEELFLQDLWEFFFKESKKKNDNKVRGEINTEFQEKNNQPPQPVDLIKAAEYTYMDGEREEAAEYINIDEIDEDDRANIEAAKYIYKEAKENETVGCISITEEEQKKDESTSKQTKEIKTVEYINIVDGGMRFFQKSSITSEDKRTVQPLPQNSV